MFFLGVAVVAEELSAETDTNDDDTESDGDNSDEEEVTKSFVHECSRQHGINIQTLLYVIQ